MSHLTIRRSSSPIRKPSRPSDLLPSITRAATYPSLPLPQPSFPISPNSCFTDDTALEHLLATSLPSRPSSPSPSYPIPISPAHSDVTQFPFLLPKPIHSLNPNQTMSNPSGSSSRNNRTTTNRNTTANTNRRNTSRNSTNPPTTSRTNNRRRRSSSGASNNESTSRRRSNNPPNESLRCDVCHQYYSRRDNLRVHQRVHTGVRPYQCRFCAQRFRWLGALRNHEANHIRDGDQALNPPPPGARQPAASSSRSPTPAETPNSRSDRRHRSGSNRQATATPTAPRQPTSPRAPTTQQVQAPTSTHRAQRTSPSQHRRSHPTVPNLDFDIPNRHVTVTEEEPQISPLYNGPHDHWGILDDLTEDRSRD